MSGATIIGQCALCLGNRPLCKSHIIPEFCYKPTYDRKHRGRQLSTEKKGFKYVQKGTRERLLCEDCEQKIGRHEKYFKEFWFDGGVLPTAISQRYVRVRGAEYSPFKLFHLSVLWRAGASKLGDFDVVSLGPYAEKLRIAILNDDPGEPGEYPFIGQVIVNDQQRVEHRLVSGPYRSRVDHFHVYYLCYAGCEWSFIVTDSRHEKYENITVQLNGSMARLAVPLRETNTVKVFTKQRDRL